MTITAYILLRDYESVIRRSCSSLEFETETGVYLIGLRSTDLAVRWYSRPPGTRPTSDLESFWVLTNRVT